MSDKMRVILCRAEMLAIGFTKLPCRSATMTVTVGLAQARINRSMTAQTASSLAVVQCRSSLLFALRDPIG